MPGENVKINSGTACLGLRIVVFIADKSIPVVEQRVFFSGL
jgi:hypothetical protein